MSDRLRAATYTWGRRPALTQVRVLAVGLVLAFHADLAPTGFVGVDVFFVLSGFLIVNNLWDRIGASRSVGSSLARFYGGRLKRLLPVSSLVLVATTVAVALYFDTAHDAVGESVRASALWFQNWSLIARDADYFAPVGADPFTHYWSLAIEEQYYLLFPLVVIAVLAVTRRMPSRTRLYALLGVALAGVAASTWWNVTWGGTETGRYLATHTRAYQLLAGVATMAVLRLLAGRVSMRRFLLPSMVGLVVLSFTDFTTRYQSGLLATLFAVGLVAAGDEVTVRRPFLEYLGDLSYGVYLWHYPIAVYLIEEVRDVSPWVVLLITTVGAHLLAAVTFHSVERPLMRRHVVSFPRLARGAGIALASVVVLSFLVLRPEPDRLVAVPDASANPTTGSTTGPERSANPTTTTESKKATTTTTTTTTTTPVAKADLGPLTSEQKVVDYSAHSTERCPSAGLDACLDTAGSPRVLLLGDSFSDKLFPALFVLAQEHGWAFGSFTTPGCPWVPTVIQHLPGSAFVDGCRRSKQSYEDVLKHVAPDVVIIHSFPYVSLEADYLRSTAEGEPKIGAEGYLAATTAAIRDLNSRGIDVIAVETTPVPDDKENIDSCVRANGGSGENCAFTYPHYDDALDQLYEKEDKTNPKFEYISINDWFCVKADCFAGYRGNVVMADSTHLNSYLLVESRLDFLALLTGTKFFG